jgi:hypothetical protein
MHVNVLPRFSSAVGRYWTNNHSELGVLAKDWQYWLSAGHKFAKPPTHKPPRRKRKFPFSRICPNLRHFWPEFES